MDDTSSGRGADGRGADDTSSGRGVDDILSMSDAHKI